MPKKSSVKQAAEIVQTAAVRPAKGSDQETKELAIKIIDLLIDHDRVQVSRVLATVGTFYSSQITVKPSGGVGSLP